MFNNLIESSSHGSEFRRRGSFFLFTTAIYSLLFIVAGVISIFAYDARLVEQSTELTMLTFAPYEVSREVAPAVRNNHPDNSPDNTSNVLKPVRPVLIDRSNNPVNPPDKIGIVAQSIPSAPPNAIIGSYVSDPPGVGGNPNGFGPGSIGGGGSGGITNIELATPPPAVPAPSPKRILTSPTVLNSKAIALPKPPYPPIAKQMGIHGSVNVQVLIDETGRVVSARAVQGSPFLIPEAQKAAYQARFSPTMIGDQAVKVSGVIVYNFVLQ